MTDRPAAAQQALRDRVAALSGHPAPGDVFEHDKGGRYVVVAVGLKEDTLTEAVAYRGPDGSVWFRTLDDWLAPVVGPDGRLRPRFVLAGGGNA